MLQTQTVTSDTLELLKKIQSIPEIKEFRLVGGTALALQIGHRFSIDLDFFSYNTEIPQDIQSILLDHNFKVENISLTDRVKIFKVNEIKIDFVNYRYDWLTDLISVDGISLASLKDIAAMKLSAITNRGTKKDFIDLYYLLDIFDFEEMLSFYRNKYPEATDFLLYKSLLYFDDAESDPMPKMFEKISWQSIKNRFSNLAKERFL